MPRRTTQRPSRASSGARRRAHRPCPRRAVARRAAPDPRAASSAAPGIVALLAPVAAPRKPSTCSPPAEIDEVERDDRHGCERGRRRQVSSAGTKAGATTTGRNLAERREREQRAGRVRRVDEPWPAARAPRSRSRSRRRGRRTRKTRAGQRVPGVDQDPFAGQARPDEKVQEAEDRDGLETQHRGLHAGHGADTCPTAANTICAAGG